MAKPAKRPHITIPRSVQRELHTKEFAKRRGLDLPQIVAKAALNGFRPAAVSSADGCFWLNFLDTDGRSIGSVPVTAAEMQVAT